LLIKLTVPQDNIQHEKPERDKLIVLGYKSHLDTKKWLLLLDIVHPLLLSGKVLFQNRCFILPGL